MNKLFNRKQGFTLLEILVSVVLVALIGTMASAALFSLLRGATKSEAMKDVKQNGDFAMNQMTRKLRNARITDTECGATGSGANNLLFTDLNGNADSYTCANDSGVNRLTDISGNFITSNTVNITDCNAVFICENNYDSHTVKISFVLSQANANANAAESATQDFQTQINLRNN